MKNWRWNVLVARPNAEQKILRSAPRGVDAEDDDEFADDSCRLGLPFCLDDEILKVYAQSRTVKKEAPSVSRIHASIAQEASIRRKETHCHGLWKNCGCCHLDLTELPVDYWRIWKLTADLSLDLLLPLHDLVLSWPCPFRTPLGF